MRIPVNNSGLTEEDEETMLVGMILVGTTKLILTRKLIGRNVNLYAKAQSHHQIKSIVSTLLLTNLRTITKNKPTFTQSDIKERLPEDWKIIDPADLSRILQYLVKVSAITPVPRPIRKKWGRQKEDEVHIDRRGSYYRISDYYTNLERVLTCHKAQIA
jgi:hypothetical protein